MADISKIKTLDGTTYDIKDASIRNSIASNYDSASAYAVGDYCLYGGTLYKCNTEIATGGEPWTSSHWTQVNIVDEMGRGGDISGVVRADVEQSFTGSEKQQARNNISAESKSLRFFNIIVPIGAFDKNEDSYAITITINTAATDTSDLIIDREVFDQAFLNLNLSEGTYTFSMTNGRFIISPGNISTDYFEFNTTSKTYLMPSWGMTINKNNYSTDSGNWFTLTYVAPHTVSPYEDYPCRATISLTNVTSYMIPDVIFGTEDATSGIFSPNSKTYNGGIYIYSSEIPSEDVTIPTIVCWTHDRNSTDNWGTVSQNIYTITLPASGWVSTDSTEQYWHVGNPYYQVVAIPNAVTTSYTKVDLQPNTQVLTHLDSVHATGIYTENHNGEITVYVNGGKPIENLSIQCTVLEMDTQDPIGNYVGMPTSSDEYHNFADMDGTSYINSTNWESWHTGFHLKNGWGMIAINGAAKIAMSANTFYEIVDLPSFLVEKIGATEQIGFAFAGSVPCMAELNTWDGEHAIRLYPKAAVGANTNIQGTIIFVVS